MSVERRVPAAGFLLIGTQSARLLGPFHGDADVRGATLPSANPVNGESLHYVNALTPS
jgi:hypothetical protein